MATKIKSVEFDGDVLTVKAIVDNGFVQDEIQFFYDVETDEISSDSPMNNTNGWLLFLLLQDGGHEKILEEFQDHLINT